MYSPHMLLFVDETGFVSYQYSIAATTEVLGERTNDLCAMALVPLKLYPQSLLIRSSYSKTCIFSNQLSTHSICTAAYGFIQNQHVKCIIPF